MNRTAGPVGTTTYVASILAIALLGLGGCQSGSSIHPATGGTTAAGGAASGGNVGSGGMSSGGEAGSAGQGGLASTGGTAGTAATGDGGSPPDDAGSDAVGLGGSSGPGIDARDAIVGGGGAPGTDAGSDGKPAGDGGLAMTSVGSLLNGIQWADTSGNPIQAHGGGVIKVGDAYYWFGENRNPDGTFFAVSCYRSVNLVDWEFRNNVLTQGSAPELKPANIERPKVIYNASTKRYVMWMHWENGTNYSASRAAVASSATIDGNYTYHGSARPLTGGGVSDHGTSGYQSRDSTLFVDTDGAAYFLSSSNENFDLNLYRLTSDYLSIDKLAAVLFPGGHREAPALWKRNNVYFLLTSAATGWDPNQAQYATSSSLTSGWTAWTNVGDATTFHSQSTFVLPVVGASGTTATTSYLYIGDRWARGWGEPVNSSTYIVLPIAFPSNTSMTMTWSNSVTVDTAAGTIAGANSRFTFLNKASGKAMTVEGASTAEHAAVVQRAPNGGPEQQWNLVYDGAGYFTLSNVNSTRALDVTSSSTADGAALIQYSSTDGDNQKWRIIDKGAGNYQILNKHSTKVVEVAASSTTDGAPLNQRSSSGGDNQLWKMTIGK